MYTNQLNWFVLLILFKLSSCEISNHRNVNKEFRNSGQSDQPMPSSKSKELDEPISMASAVVPKYFPNQQKAYHQQFDKSAVPRITKKSLNKPKLGQQISLNHQSFNNAAESVAQSSRVLLGSGFSLNEFGKEYPYKPTFLRFDSSDGRTQLDTAKPTLRMDNLKIANIYEQPVYKPPTYQLKTTHEQTSPSSYTVVNHQPNYYSSNEYEPTENEPSTVKEPQITYSKYPVALPMYSMNYKPTPINQQSAGTTYTSPPYLVSEHSPNYAPDHPSNYKPNDKNYNNTPKPQRPSYVVEHKPVHSQAESYSQEDKSLEETIAELPNILAKTIPDLITGGKSAYNANAIKLDSTKLDYKPNVMKPIYIEIPKRSPNERKHLPPYRYAIANKDQHLKERGEMHKKHRFDSSHQMVSNRNPANYNRLHKDEYYSNNYQATTHYVHNAREVPAQPYTTYMNNSDLADYEGSSVYETKYSVDESKKQNKTKKYFLVYKLDDKRLEDELKLINHHFANAEDRVNAEDDYHEVVNLEPAIEEHANDGLERLFTIDTMNSLSLKENNNNKNEGDEYSTGQADLRTFAPNRKYSRDMKPAEKVYHHSMRDRDQPYNQYSPDGKSYSGPAQPPKNYDQLNRQTHNAARPYKSVENLEYATHYQPDLQRISSLGNHKYNSTNSFNYNNGSNVRSSYDKPYDAPNGRPYEKPIDRPYSKPFDNNKPYDKPVEQVNRFEADRLNHERIYLFANNEKQHSSFEKEIRPTYPVPHYSERIDKNVSNYSNSPDYKAGAYKPGDYVAESFNLKSEYNDHKKETSVLKVKTYDDYLHQNYGKAKYKAK